MLVRRIGQPRADREQIALDRARASSTSSARRASDARARPSQAFSSSTSPYASTRGSALRHARAVEQAGLAAVAGLGVDFHDGDDYTRCLRTRRSAVQAASPTLRRRQRFRQRLLDVVPAPRPRSAVAQDRRPVPHPRVRDHAAADAGRSRAAEVPRVAGRSTRRSRRSPPRRKRTSPRPGVRSATTSGRGGCRRSRASRSRATAASCRRTRRRCCRSRASARTRPARSCSFAFGERAAILDTNVARVLFRVFVGRGDPKAHAMKQHLWDVSRDGAAAPPRLRLQPGADGLRRHALHGAQAQVPGLPDAGRLRAYPFKPDNEQRMTDRRRRGGHRGARPLPRHAAAAGRAPRGLLGVSRRQVRARRIARGVPATRDAGGARDERGHQATSFSACRTTTPIAPSSCTSSRAALDAPPMPLLGQEMRWVSASELRIARVPAGRRSVDRVVASRRDDPRPLVVKPRTAGC